MTFQASEFKGKHFLELINDNYLLIKPVYTKNSMWLKSIRYSNSLYMKATRAIMNHTPTGEYHLRFFPKENFSCSCSYYPIESRHIIFPEFNSKAFFFTKKLLDSVFFLLSLCSLVLTFSFCFFLPFSFLFFSLSSLYKQLLYS